MATLGELKVKITGDTSSLDRALGSTRSKLESMEQGLTSLGQTLTASVTAPLVGMAGAAVSSFNSFDSAIAGVSKTVDASQEDFRALVGQLEEMTTRLPASIEEISGVAEAAGQLGIKTEDIAKFTETMINLGETTNLTSDQAATSLARFSNIMGTSADDVERLGSTIVDLGNNFATTEAEIVEMGSRLAGAGKQIGLTEAEVFGLSTALTSVGINAEAGGTAFSRVMLEMQKAVDEGGEKMETFAQVAGMSAEEFARTMEEDASEALIAFVEGLDRVETTGGSTTAVFERLELGSVRVQDALRRSASAGDLMRDALSRGSVAWEENTALAAEAEQRYNTFDAQLSVLKNRVVAVARDVGAILMPQFMALANAGTELVERFSGLSDEQKSLGVALAGLTASAGPVLIVLGKLVGATNGLIGVLAPVITSLGSFMGTMGSVAAAATGLGGTLASLVGGTGAIALFAGFARAIIRNWVPLVQFFEDLREDIAYAVQVTVETVRRIWENNRAIIIGTVASITNSIAEIFEGLAVILAAAVRAIRDSVMWVWNAFGESIKDVVENALRFVTNLFAGVGNILAGIINTIAGVITGDWTRVWDGLKMAAKGAMDSMKSLVLAIVNNMLIALKSAFDWAPWIGPKIEAAQQAVEDFITEDQKKRLADDVDDMKTDVEEGFSLMGSAATSTKDTVVGEFDRLLAGVNKTLSPAEPTSIATKAKETADKTVEEFDRMKRDGIDPLADSFGGLSEEVEYFREHGVEGMDTEIIEVEGTVDGLKSSTEDLNDKIEAGSVAMEDRWAAAAEEARLKAEAFEEEVDALTETIEDDFERAIEGAVGSIMDGEGLAPSVNYLKERFKDLIREGIASTVVKLLKGEESLGSALGKTVDKITGVIRNLTGEGGLLSVFGRVGRGIGTFVGQLTGGGSGSLASSLGSVIGKVGSLGSTLTGLVTTGGPLAVFAAASLKIFRDWEGSVGSIFRRAGEGIKGIIGSIGGDLANLFGGGSGGGRGDAPDATQPDEDYLWKQAFGSSWDYYEREAKRRTWTSINSFIGWAMGLAEGGSSAVMTLAGYLERTNGLPGLAEGGIAFGPTLAQIGDNLNAQINPEVVAPLSDLQSILMNTVNAGGGGATHQTIVVNLDGRRIAETTAKNLPEYLEVMNLR